MHMVCERNLCFTKQGGEGSKTQAKIQLSAPRKRGFVCAYTDGISFGVKRICDEYNIRHGTQNVPISVRGGGRNN